ncbi:MAG: response regulator [Anaerolineales bacterium]|nr:response regulator [Anaerolineales bacterium]
MKKRLLIIDDNVVNLKVAINTLESYDFEVLMARNGQDGLERAAYTQPDLILLDIKMPEMDGYEVCRRLKAAEQTRHIPVIFISALDDVFDKTTAFSIGGVDYITKPFQTEELLARVRTHLALLHMQQELQIANETLEEKVRARTAQLAEANTRLEAEIEQRKQQQQEKDRLFAVVSQQSEQLRNLTTLLIQSRQAERQELAADIQAEIEQNITITQANVTLARQLLESGQPELAAEQLATTAQVLAHMEQYVGRLTAKLPLPTPEEAEVSEDLLVKLSEREREVLLLLAEGKSASQVAAILNLTTGSVHTYNRRIRQKLDLPDLSSLIKFAVDNNLIEK